MDGTTDGGSDGDPGGGGDPGSGGGSGAYTIGGQSFDLVWLGETTAAGPSGGGLEAGVLVRRGVRCIGSSAGAQALQDGTLDLAGMSRDLRSAESSAGLANTQVGHAAWVFLINDNSPVADMTLAQLQEVVSENLPFWESLQ